MADDEGEDAIGQGSTIKGTTLTKECFDNFRKQLENGGRLKLSPPIIWPEWLLRDRERCRQLQRKK